MYVRCAFKVGWINLYVSYGNSQAGFWVDWIILNQRQLNLFALHPRIALNCKQVLSNFILLRYQLKPTELKEAVLLT